MDVTPTSLPDVLLIVPPRFGDERGWFSEVWNAARYREAGIEADFVQDNHSFSAQRGTLRGLHYQSPPFAQDKLVRCTRGSILDVAVDIRSGSETFGKWTSARLSAEKGEQLFVPKGFLHGFVTLTQDCEVQYKCSALYAPKHDGSVRWDDPAIGIDWQLDGLTPILSGKDAAAPLLADIGAPF